MISLPGPPRRVIVAYALPAFVVALPTIPVYIHLPTLYGIELGLGLAATGIASSKGDARRTVAQGGIRINGSRIEDGDPLPPAVDGRWLLIQKGKKQRHLVVFKD